MLLRHVWTLVDKEWHQHRRALGILALCLLGFWVAAWLAFSRGTRGVTLFALLPSMAKLAFPVALVVLGHHLVVTEYYGRTQRFLEALPLRRSLEATVKALFGLGVALFAGLAMVGLTSLGALAHEPVGGRFFAILALRLGGYLFCLWGIVFLFSMFGRLRAPLLLLATIVFALVKQNSEVSFDNVGPLGLINDSTMSVERLLVPWRSVGWALGLGGLAYALAIALVRVREGSIVESLARPMSLREKVALWVVLLGGLAALIATEPKKATPMPPADTDALLEAPGKLEVLYLAEQIRPLAARAAARVSPLLLGLGDLVPGPPPRVRLVHGADLRPEQFFVEPHGRDGIVMRVNLQAFADNADAGAGHEVRVTAAIIRSLIVAAVGDDVTIEPRHWLLSGFALHVASQGWPGTARKTEPATGSDVVVVAALAAAAARDFALPSADGLATHYALAEALGEFPVSALEATGFRVLQERFGSGAVLHLAKAAFGRLLTDDVRDFLERRRRPPALLVETATGRGFAEFVATWQAWLRARAAEPAIAAKLTRLPRANVALTAAENGVDPAVVRGRFQTAPSAGECVVAHRLERWFDTYAPTDPISEERIVVDRNAFAHAIDADYETGERLFVTLECRPPEAPFGVRLFAGRMTAP